MYQNFISLTKSDSSFKQKRFHFWMFLCLWIGWREEIEKKQSSEKDGEEKNRFDVGPIRSNPFSGFSRYQIGIIRIHDLVRIQNGVLLVRRRFVDLIRIQNGVLLARKRFFNLSFFIFFFIFFVADLDHGPDRSENWFWIESGGSGWAEQILLSSSDLSEKKRTGKIKENGKKIDCF